MKPDSLVRTAAWISIPFGVLAVLSGWTLAVDPLDDFLLLGGVGAVFIGVLSIKLQ